MKKKIVIISFLLFTGFWQLGGQVTWNVAAGAGISTSLPSNKYNNNMKGYLSPVIGIYPSVLIKNKLRVSTGIEMLGTGTYSKYENENLNNGYKYYSKSTTRVNKLNTPLLLGWDFNWSILKISPFVGINLNYSLQGMQTTLTNEGKGTIMNRSILEDPYTLETDQTWNNILTQKAFGVKFIYKSKFEMDISYSIGSTYYRSYEDYTRSGIIDCFCGALESFQNNDLKLVLKYTLF